MVVYPPNNHQTTAEKIFLIGTASPKGQVLINGQPVDRSQAGHFAPSFPLKMGDNVFTIRYNQQEIKLKINRVSNQINPPTGVGFAPQSFTPSSHLARLPGELICFGAIGSPGARVSVNLGQQSIPLFPQSQTVQLPANSAVLTSTNESISLPNLGKYQGCAKLLKEGNLGYPVFNLSLNNQTITQQGTGQITVISPEQLEVIEVTANAGVTRTGPGTNYSRLTPLPKGTRATVTGKEGDWLRLDYGAWILKGETQTLPNAIPPRSKIRGISSRQIAGATEVIFPLETPIPLRIKQEDDKFILTLYHTTAQTDTIYIDDDPFIKRVDWEQVNPDQIDYTFFLKSQQQWGYDIRYEGTNLILTLRHPPKLSGGSLQGVTILLDPGHGGQEMGAKGPTGYPEKDVNLVVSQLIERELVKRGARVYLTRETDKDVSLPKRVEEINQLKPTLSLSVHYNALPDDGDAINTAGIGIFWYHPQAHDLSVFLHHYLVKTLNRPSYGVYWNNLALTRPHTTPSILLELGFMINPEEFEWITNSQEQQKLAQAIAEGITAWLQSQK
ncbi:cell wall hydrolase/autolysin [Gloeothece citriformis PCC 7424]|uniref:Cell wall hydrolase/autolysin n=2 Tax=Gloeothece TaxID=28070 RepID=B7KDW6_GLOC7|nr:cell wall hydrolase/autolysin [Gloeothece citriformis PCC 7424]